MDSKPTEIAFARIVEIHNGRWCILAFASVVATLIGARRSMQ
jgi:hypothetical protein